jgi:hypothetical protein
MIFPKKEEPQQPIQQQPLIYAPTSPTSTALPQAISYLLDNPSIPLTMRKQFFVLWENVIFGNYTERDIAFLMSKFREWCILTLWYIPEQRWGNILSYQDGDDKTSNITVDLNLLLNMLGQLYYINLTRGREGFTVKEMGTTRSIVTPTGVEAQKRTLRLF